MPIWIQRCLAAVGLLALSPVLGGIATAVRLLDGQPVLYRQSRVGRARKGFTILKFRTMVNGADDLLVEGMPAAHRLTRTGSLLRRTGLDELPQLWNVAKGDMALVGPRALLPEVADALPEQFHRRFTVLPGLTGQAQVSGRNTLPWSQRMALDVRYAETRSAKTDFNIIMRTLPVLFSGEGYVPDRNSADVDDLDLLAGEPR